MTKNEQKHFSVTASQFIREISKPLQKFALTNFMHDITFGKGQISMLVSDQNVFMFYYLNKIPTICTDESGRTLSAGIYINKTLEETYQECSILMPLLPKIGQQYGQDYGKNSIHICTRENDCQNLYSLFFDLDETAFLHWVINNGNLLQDIIEKYNDSARDIILQAKAPESRIILPSFKQANDITSSSEIKRLRIIHKQSHVPIFLSHQQSICLSSLMQGKPIKKIALEMNLSRRTVEHYLEKIRKTLGCSSNMELIATYGDQVTDK